jgi:putative transposase
LWNNALADRKNTWEQDRKNTSYEDQAGILTLEKQHNPYLKGVLAQAEQDVLRRLKKAFDNFFRRVCEGAKEKGIPKIQRNGSLQFIYISTIRV